MLCIDPTRGIRVCVFCLFLKSGNVLAGVIFIFGPIFLFFLWFSLVPVPLFFSVESENTVQIVLNGFVLTLSAIYGYAVAKIQENGNFPDLYFLYLLSYFNFFLSQLIDLIKYYLQITKYVYIVGIYEYLV